MSARDGRADTPAAEQTLEPRLAEQLMALGIDTEYEDAFGQLRRIDPDVAVGLVRAMGIEPGAAAPSEGDAVIVTRPDRRDASAPGTLVLENGGRLAVDGRLPAGLPLGYHLLERADGGTSSVIVSPGVCAAHPARIWGWSVQVYATTSRDSWGIGDLADLRDLGAWSTSAGARVLLVNPLDAMVARPSRPDSPYSPSSRRFLDPLYLRIEDVPGAESIAGELADLAAHVQRGDGRIDRASVADTKYEALEQIFVTASGAGREPGFRRYAAERGEVLRQFATFETLVEVHGGGWRSWPERYHDPHGDAVAVFAADHAERVTFHAWLQWLLDEQLRAAASAGPLMRDLPVGVDPDGFDAWTWQDVLAEGVTVGAPPDELGPEGQDWGLPSFVPFKLRAAAYQPFIEVVRAAFRHGAALRIDHVLGLFRMFWVPNGRPDLGSYIQQDTDELLDILALESLRAGAWVVGEDLGTVGAGVRDEMAARGMLRYRVLWFEPQPPREWDARGVAAVSTHDMPAIGGVWTGAEGEVRRQLGEEVDENELVRMRRELAERTGVDAAADTADVCVAAARVIAGAGCDVALIQLEDAIGSTHRINVPGTGQSQRPQNWSLTLPVRLEEIPTHPTVVRVVDAIGDLRPAADADSSP